MSDLGRAKDLLHEKATRTLVLVRGERVRFFEERGIKPLLALLGEGADVSLWSAADRVVGRAAAFLYVLLGIKELYADVVSELAMGVLRGHGIHVEAQTVTDRIINRAGDGPCPMESAVENTDDPGEALAAIQAKLASMKK